MFQGLVLLPNVEQDKPDIEICDANLMMFMAQWFHIDVQSLDVIIQGFIVLAHFAHNIPDIEIDNCNR